MANSGAFKKGDGRARKPKGVPNKLTMALKDMILKSLSEAGGIDYLVKQAKESPTAYLSLVGKVLPLQIKEGGTDPKVPAPVIHEHITE